MARNHCTIRPSLRTEYVQSALPSSTGRRDSRRTAEPANHELARHRTFSDTEVGLGTVVEHQHQRATDAPDHVGEEALVQTLRHALFRSDLLEAIHGALVEVLLHRLLRLHLQAAAYGVERIGRPGTDGNGSLGRREGGDRP